MVGIIIVNFFAGLLLEKTKKKKLILAAAVILNLSTLFIFKYLNFTISVIGGNAIEKLILPIGISFYIFQGISYIIDVYRDSAKAQHNLVNLALYISFFPQLIAGPIIRYNLLESQLMDRQESFDKAYEGLHRFSIGLSKKVILSNNLAIVSKLVFDSGVPQDTLMVWIGAIAYTLQIYYDFSGYSDMAIGLGKMFGFEFPENFNYPYISQTISEFWRRWHITLGTWFRDYVYFPLGGSKVKSVIRLIFNLSVVWLLTGLWHGANWTFIFWGVYNLFFIIIDKISPKIKRGKILSIASSFVTFVIIVVGWVFFRAESLGYAFEYIKVMFSFQTDNLNASVELIKEFYIFIVLGGVLSMPLHKKLIQYCNSRFKFKSKEMVFNICYDVVCIGLTIMCISFLLSNSYNPFIYFNF